MIIRDNIKHHEEPSLSTDSLQSATISVTMKRIKCKVSAIYFPPKFNIKEEEYSSFLQSLGNSFIVGGDFNAKHTEWGSKYSSTKGKELYKTGQALKSNFISSGSLTYWPTDPNKLLDAIDFFIVKGISTNYVQAESCLDISSDHTPVLLTISETIITKQPPISICNKHTNWENFKSDLENMITLHVPLKTKDQLEADAELFTKQIQTTAKSNTPELKIKPPHIMNYPMEVKELIQEKRKARKKWQTTRNPQRKTELNRISQQLKRLIQKLKNESIEGY